MAQAPSYLGRRDAGIQPERGRRVPQVVGPAYERRGNLRLGQRLLAGQLPPPVVDRLGERPTVQAPEESTVRADPVILDVRAQQLDEPGRDRDRPSLSPPPVLESAPLVGAAVIGPSRRAPFADRRRPNRRIPGRPRHDSSGHSRTTRDRLGGHRARPRNLRESALARGRSGRRSRDGNTTAPSHSRSGACNPFRC